MEKRQIHTWKYLNLINETQEQPLYSLTNAQYFVRELVHKHDFSLVEISKFSWVSLRTLKKLYTLKTRSTRKKAFNNLLGFYCGVTHMGIRPQWYQRAVKVAI